MSAVLLLLGVPKMFKPVAIFAHIVETCDESAMVERHRQSGLTDKNIALIRQVLTEGVWSRVVNLPEQLMAAAREHCPPGVELSFSVERELLDTGGGIRRLAGFLRESDPCLVIGGDMRFHAAAARGSARRRVRQHRNRRRGTHPAHREALRSRRRGGLGPLHLGQCLLAAPLRLSP